MVFLLKRPYIAGFVTPFNLPLHIKQQNYSNLLSFLFLLDGQ
jgi:hypothetical protein